MSNIRGLHDVKERAEGDGDDAARANQFYVGGAAQGGSGTNVVAPKKEGEGAGSVNAAEVVDKVFESARSHGAISKSDEPEPERARFAGVGQTLSGQSVPAPEATPSVPRCVITFYQDAFTVDDGPPRVYADPANAAFLDEVNRGRVPREIHARLGEDVDVELIDKKSEKWRDVPKPFKPFTSQGHSLADSTPSSAARVVEGRLATVDASAPTTSLRVTLHDGSRIVVKLNHSHTVADLRAHIEATKPSGRAFELRTMAPPSVLEVDHLTLKEANLLNAALVQRLL